MDTKYNPLGFNKQTEALLCGVGGNNLIKEFKKRDISSNVLHKLRKEDFVQLGNNICLLLDNSCINFMLEYFIYRDLNSL